MTLGGEPSAVPTTRTEGMLAVMASGHLCGYEYTDAERVRSNEHNIAALNIDCNGVHVHARQRAEGTRCAVLPPVLPCPIECCTFLCVVLVLAVIELMKVWVWE